MNVTPYSYLDLTEAISIEKRYTIEDLTFSWQMGYGARIQEERENERMRSSGDNDEGYDSKLRGTNETSKIFGRDEYRS
jgi:hypothetical protein